jgi:hypothetical protein
LTKLGAMGINFLDSPATTSSTTYKVQAQAQSGGTAVGRTVMIPMALLLVVSNQQLLLWRLRHDHNAILN